MKTENKADLLDLNTCLDLAETKTNTKTNTNTNTKKNMFISGKTYIALVKGLRLDKYSDCQNRIDFQLTFSAEDNLSDINRPMREKHVRGWLIKKVFESQNKTFSSEHEQTFAKAEFKQIVSFLTKSYVGKSVSIKCTSTSGDYAEFLITALKQNKE